MVKLTKKSSKIDFSKLVSISPYDHLFRFYSQKERINCKNDQKVIKNRLLKTDVLLVIRPFVAILEPKEAYKW